MAEAPNRGQDLEVGTLDPLACLSHSFRKLDSVRSLVSFPHPRRNRLDVCHDMAMTPLVLRAAPPDLALVRWRTAPNAPTPDERALAPPMERVRHFSVPNIVDDRRARETDAHLTYVGSWFCRWTRR